jgi:hypothetical protein
LESFLKADPRDEINEMDVEETEQVICTDEINVDQEEIDEYNENVNDAYCSDNSLNKDMHVDLGMEIDDIKLHNKSGLVDNKIIQKSKMNNKNEGLLLNSNAFLERLKNLGRGNDDNSNDIALETNKVFSDQLFRNFKKPLGPSSKSKTKPKIEENLIKFNQNNEVERDEVFTKGSRRKSISNDFKEDGINIKFNKIRNKFMIRKEM